jgi:hypothetical protein
VDAEKPEQSKHKSLLKLIMKVLSFEKMSSIEGGEACVGYTGKYCPLAFLVLITGYKTGSFFARYAGKALKQVLCTPTCGGDNT